jgi:hypothetical protein
MSCLLGLLAVLFKVFAVAGAITTVVLRPRCPMGLLPRPPFFLPPLHLCIVILERAQLRDAKA